MAGRNASVVDPKGRPIALQDLADVAFEEGPNEVERENVQRRAVVGANVLGRDIAEQRHGNAVESRGSDDHALQRSA